GIAWPARLHRQPREIDVGTLPDDLLARPRRSLLRCHVQHLHEYRPRVLPRVLQAFRRIGFLEKREQLADLAQRRDRVLAHPHRDALRRAEQVAEDRHRVALGLFEQQRRTARLEHAVADLGHFEPRVDGGGDALQLAAAFELREEIAEVGVFHGNVDGEPRGPMTAWYQTPAGTMNDVLAHAADHAHPRAPAGLRHRAGEL